jgi:hypothetical protein
MARAETSHTIVRTDDERVVPAPRPPVRVDIEYRNSTAWCIHRDASTLKVGSDLCICRRRLAAPKQRSDLVNRWRRRLMHDDRCKVSSVDLDVLAVTSE